MVRTLPTQRPAKENPVSTRVAMMRVGSCRKAHDAKQAT